MIEFDYDDTQFVITASRLERDIVKTINGVKAKGEDRWVAPALWPIYVDATSTITAAHGAVTEAARAWGRAAGNQIKALLGMKQWSTERLSGGTLGLVDLFAGQRLDAEWLVESGGSGFLFSDMRTGKSFTALKALDDLDAFPALIVCPPGVTFEWERNLHKAFPDRTYTVLSSGMTAAQRKKALAEPADIVVAGYNLLAKHSKIGYWGGLSTKQRAKELAKDAYEEKELNAYGFRTLIADEAHNIKDPGSQQTRACWYLGDRCENRIALTGTPTSKPGQLGKVNPQDLWALLRFVYPLCFPAKSKFEEKYLLMRENFFGIRECHGINPDRQKLWDMVFEPMYVRRMRNISTAKEYRVIPVELDSKQRKAYKQLAEFQMAQIGDELLTADDALVLRRRMIQAASAYPLVEDGKLTRLTVPSSKLTALLEWLAESDDKAIVFTDSRLLFNLIQDTFLDEDRPFASFPGGLTDAQRAAAVDLFNEQPGVGIFLGMIQAANAGIDLSAARRTIFVTVADDAVQMLQAEDRGLGPTQQASVYEVAYLIAKDTIDEACYDVFSSKEDNLHQLFRDPEWIRRSL